MPPVASQCASAPEPTIADKGVRRIGNVVGAGMHRHLPAMQDLMGRIVQRRVLLGDRDCKVLRLIAMFHMEDMVDRRQSHVFVHASVARKVVIAHRRHHDFADGIMDAPGGAMMLKSLKLTHSAMALAPA